jgi:hypothetical protein
MGHPAQRASGQCFEHWFARHPHPVCLLFCVFLRPFQRPSPSPPAHLQAQRAAPSHPKVRSSPTPLGPGRDPGSAWPTPPCCFCPPSPEMATRHTVTHPPRARGAFRAAFAPNAVCPIPWGIPRSGLQASASSTGSHGTPIQSLCCFVSSSGRFNGLPLLPSPILRPKGPRHVRPGSKRPSPQRSRRAQPAATLGPPPAQHVSFSFTVVAVKPHLLPVSLIQCHSSISFASGGVHSRPLGFRESSSRPRLVRHKPYRRSAN